MCAVSCIIMNDDADGGVLSLFTQQESSFLESRREPAGMSMHWAEFDMM